MNNDELRADDELERDKKKPIKNEPTIFTMNVAYGKLVCGMSINKR